MSRLLVSHSLVSDIKAWQREQILNHFAIKPRDLLAVGSEAEVYALGQDQVLKLYADKERWQDFQILRRFYAGLSFDITSNTAIKTPLINDIFVFQDHLVVIEQRIVGRSYQNLIEASKNSKNRSDFLRWVKKYFIAIKCLENIKVSWWPSEAYLLLDKKQYSLRSQGTWCDFLIKLIQKKIKVLAPVWQVPKVDILLKALQRLKFEKLSLVHGDIWPGNVLFSNDFEVSGVIDFGMLSMLGDAQFDVAVAWSEHTMYTAENYTIRHQLVPVLAEIYGDLSRIAVYALVHALLTCDLWAVTKLSQDVHFNWAKSLYLDELYWKLLSGSSSCS